MMDKKAILEETRQVWSKNQSLLIGLEKRLTPHITVIKETNSNTLVFT
jgi:hypothetical protein